MEGIITLTESSSLEAINRSEIDMQIATAKRFPRNIDDVIAEIGDIAGHDLETAASCFYHLERQGKEINGLSVRMAEIIAAAWGNLRVASRVIGNDGKTITAQAVCMDLQKNVAVSTEVKRSIRTKSGATYSEDMQVVTGNAACAIAFRNAVLKVVPSATIKRIINKVKSVAEGETMDLEQMRTRMINWFAEKNVDQATLFEYLEINDIEQMTNKKVMKAYGVCQSIIEGDSTIQEAIFDELAERKRAKLSEKKADNNKDKVAQAMAKNAVK